jgi:hypothetical protein
VSFLRSFWGSLVMLIALMLILEKAGGFSTDLQAGGDFVSKTVRSFK